MLALLGPVEVVVLLLFLCSCLLRIPASYRCFRLLFKRRFDGNTKWEDYKVVYIAIGLNVGYCVAELFFIPLFFVDLFSIFRTYHTKKAFTKMRKRDKEFPDLNEILGKVNRLELTLEALKEQNKRSVLYSSPLSGLPECWRGMSSCV